MRKILLILMSVLVISGQAYANTISVPAFSADSSVDHLNTFRTTVVNVANGNISGAAGTGATINILADSVAEIDMADDANPRVRDSYLLGITYDTISGGVAASQGAFVKSGGVPATDSDLTSDVSAIIAFVNGYYISKAATAQTYADGSTTYLWLNQSGSYVQSTNPNTSISNAALIASVVTSGGQITTVTDLANRRLPGLIVPSNYRTGLYVSRDSSATITLFPGSGEINNTTLSKTSVNTLNIGTAGDWAGGVSLRATSTYGYVGIDASGNLKLHTTAPTHSNYALSITTGKKRYASWSSTTYRILGWFYMNATGSGELNTYEVGNIKEGDVSNFNSFNSNVQVSTASTTALAADTEALIRFYSSGNPIIATYSAGTGNSGASETLLTMSVDSIGIVGNFRSSLGTSSATTFFSVEVKQPVLTASQGTHTVQGYLKVGANTGYVNNRTVTIEEK